MDENAYTGLAVRIATLESKAEATEEKIGEMKKEISDIRDIKISLVQLTTGIENLGNNLLDMKDDVKVVKKGQDELSSKVNELESRPARETKRRLDDIVDKLIWVFIGGVAAFLLAQALPKIF